MAGETLLTICGNTTGPSELRFTPSGAAVATFTVASTPRTFDKNSNSWVDGDTLFLRCSAWREMAENVAESITDKGMRVIVQGRLKQRSYEKDGQKRTVIELEVDEIGPSLKYANAKVNRTQRSGNQGGGSSQGGNDWNGAGGRSSSQASAQADPWAAPATNAGQDRGAGWGNGPDTEPPF